MNKPEKDKNLHISTFENVYHYKFIINTIFQMGFV